MPNINNKNLISSVSLVLLGVLIGWAGLYLVQQEGWIYSSADKTLSPERAGEQVLDYLNQNILKGQGLQASLVETPIRERGVYKLRIKIGNDELISYMTEDGKMLFPQGISLEQKIGEKVEEKNTTLGNFSRSQDEVCREDGKPIVYFFGADWCPHCQWEHPIVKNVAEDFKGYISFHDNMGSDQERDVFLKYSQGGVPTLVIGCRYFRVGSGENLGEEEESKILTALICDLTERQPLELCQAVEDLIEQIK